MACLPTIYPGIGHSGNIRQLSCLMFTTAVATANGRSIRNIDSLGDPHQVGQVIPSVTTRRPFYLNTTIRFPSPESIRCTLSALAASPIFTFIALWFYAKSICLHACTPTFSQRLRAPLKHPLIRAMIQQYPMPVLVRNVLAESYGMGEEKRHG